MSEKQVVFRIDVDTPTGSLVLNRLHLRKGYLKYLGTVIQLMKEFGIKASFMFIPARTTPTPEILTELLDTESEVALHADEVLPERLAEQKAEMERTVGRSIVGISYHGRDLVDLIAHAITRKHRYLAYHNPYSSMLAGFRYDATGVYQIEKPEFLHLSNRRILLFPSYRDITYGEPIARLEEIMLQKELNIYMIHPNYIDKYGFRRKRRDEVRSVFEYVTRKEAQVRTYAELCEEYERMAGSR